MIRIIKQAKLKIFSLLTCTKLLKCIEFDLYPILTWKFTKTFIKILM